MHQVVRAPREGGAVYSVVPVSEPTKIRHVHRSLLKIKHSGGLPIQDPQCCPPTQQVVQEEEENDEGDLFMLIPSEQQVSGVVGVEGPDGEKLPHSIIPSSVVPLSDVHPEIRETRERVICSETMTDPATQENGVWRTTRATAGYHSNIHCLPRAAREPTFDPDLGVTSNMVSVFFRPWY